MESFLKHTTNQSFKKMLQRNEALEYDNSDEHDFAIKLVSEIDDKIGSIDSEIDKDLRSGKTTGKRLGIQVVLEDGKRRLFVEYAI
jgi:transcription termination factor NusB